MKTHTKFNKASIVLITVAICNLCFVIDICDSCFIIDNSVKIIVWLVIGNTLICAISLVLSIISIRQKVNSWGIILIVISVIGLLFFISLCGVIYLFME